MISKTFNVILDEVSNFVQATGEAVSDMESNETALSRYVKIRDKKKLTKLYEEFKDTYGIEGEKIVSNPSKAVYFNGGIEPEKPEKYFTGLHYSLPLLAYVMRRALDKCDEDTSYRKYIKNVDVLTEEKNEETIAYNLTCAPDEQRDLIEIKAYPSQYMIEKLCAPTLRALDNVLTNMALQQALAPDNDGEGSGNGQDITDSVDP